MKRVFLFTIVIAILCCACGCEKSTDTAKGARFDVNDMQLTTNVSSGGTAQDMPEPYATYSSVMEDIGEDGIIVAGYATGMRESVWSRRGSYTRTDFVVTDVYRGELTEFEIKIRENYAVLEQGGERFFHSRESIKEWLQNDIQVLVFLEPLSDGDYWLHFRHIPLMEDYNNYNEEYLKSVLNFFRGDESQYIAQEGYWTECYVRESNGEEVGLSHYVAYWSKREISDEALLAEMNDHLLIRIATDYEIAIWPYAHKNFKLHRYADRQFGRICIPSEEFFT